MKLLRYLAIFGSICFVSCSIAQNEVPEMNSAPTPSVQADFIPLPFGQPTSSTLKNYRWGTLQGDERIIAMKTSNSIFLKSLAQADYVLEDLDLDNKSLMAKSIQTIENRLASLDSEDLFLTEQIIADKLERKIFENISSQDAIHDNKNKVLSDSELLILNYATKLFVRNANPNAELIALNLHHLSGKIDDQLLQQYAIQSIVNAEQWFGSDRLCIDCARKSNPALTVDDKIQSVNSGIRQLEKYAGN